MLARWPVIREQTVTLTRSHRAEIVRDETGARANAQQNLDRGFPPVLMVTDPDLNTPPACPLTERTPLPAETCRIIL
jgi:hypothetical protein